MASARSKAKVRGDGLVSGFTAAVSTTWAPARPPTPLRANPQHSSSRRPQPIPPPTASRGAPAHVGHVGQRILKGGFRRPECRPDLGWKVIRRIARRVEETSQLRTQPKCDDAVVGSERGGCRTGGSVAGAGSVVPSALDHGVWSSRSSESRLKLSGLGWEKGRHGQRWFSYTAATCLSAPPSSLSPPLSCSRDHGVVRSELSG